MKAAEKGVQSTIQALSQLKALSLTEVWARWELEAPAINQGNMVVQKLPFFEKVA